VLTALPSSSTGASLIAGVFVSIWLVWLDTAGDVLCGNVDVREIGDMGFASEEEVGGDMGVGIDIIAGSAPASASACVRSRNRTFGKVNERYEMTFLQLAQPATAQG
jgi:hypothetical protein